MYIERPKVSYELRGIEEDLTSQLNNSLRHTNDINNI